MQVGDDDPVAETGAVAEGTSQLNPELYAYCRLGKRDFLCIVDVVGADVLTVDVPSPSAL